MRPLLAPCAVAALLVAAPAPAQPGDDALKKAVTLYASFDEHVWADVAGGGKMLNTRFNHPSQPGTFLVEPGFDDNVFRIARRRGVAGGGALEAADVLPRNGRVFFPAKGNLAYDPKGWGGALSVWCQTDPNKSLKTSFCDPVQITEKGANNGGLWFDFNDAKPRDLRHGAFPAVPAGQKGVGEDDPKAPMVRVPRVAWTGTDWHHVVLSWSGFDTGKADAVSQLYIDGKLIGEVRDRAIAMKWDVDRTGVYVAVNYVGLMDELALFRRPLTADEVKQLHQRPGLLK
ncbi:MAG TPA: LamG-like jellyroll fold domain-containing protein [Urbifossiella sp.]|nr:LamG-like jellyroll fold domain-containing protein [Urbifossiella sp.]